jgi:hypothetical protein
VECTKLLVIQLLNVVNCDRNAEGGVPRFRYGNYMPRRRLCQKRRLLLEEQVATPATALLASGDDEVNEETSRGQCSGPRATPVTVAFVARAHQPRLVRLPTGPAERDFSCRFCLREHDDRFCTR